MVSQKQRVSLARAAYADSDIIIMDDVLSAVDSHVGDHIFRNLICGFLSDRTRLLVTNQLSLVLPKADLVLCIKSSSTLRTSIKKSRGTINQSSSSSGIKISLPNQLFDCESSNSSLLLACHPSKLSASIESTGILAASNQDIDGGFAKLLASLVLISTPGKSLDNETPESKYSVEDRNSSSHLLNSNFDDFHTYSPSDISASILDPRKLPKDNNRQENILKESHSYDSRLSDSVLEFEDEDIDSCMKTMLIDNSVNNKQELSAENTNSRHPSKKGIIVDETKGTGAISWDVYWYYLSSCGGMLFGPILVFTLVWTAAAWYAQNYSMVCQSLIT